MTVQTVENTTATPSSEVGVTKDSKNLAILVWVGTIFLSFIPGLIGYLTKKDDDAFVADHSKEALNFSITVFIAYVVSMALMILLIGFLLLWGVLLWHLIQCIRGAIAASNGKPFAAPFTLRLIK